MALQFCDISQPQYKMKLTKKKEDLDKALEKCLITFHLTDWFRGTENRKDRWQSALDPKQICQIFSSWKIFPQSRQEQYFAKLICFNITRFFGTLRLAELIKLKIKVGLTILGYFTKCQPQYKIKLANYFYFKLAPFSVPERGLLGKIWIKHWKIVSALSI